MKIYKIDFDDVDYEEDYSVLVSATDRDQALIIAEITEEDEKFGSRYKSNIKLITYIGVYYKNVAEEIMYSNKGA